MISIVDSVSFVCVVFDKGYFVVINFSRQLPHIYQCQRLNYVNKEDLLRILASELHAPCVKILGMGWFEKLPG